MATVNTPEALPPHSIEAEQALLGAIFLDPRVLNDVVSIVKNEEQFYRTAHQHIYSSMVRLFNEGKEVDWITVQHELERQGIRDEHGGKDYLIQITEMMATSASALQWAEIVRDKAILREIIRSASEMRQNAYDPKVDPAMLIEKFEEEVFRLGATRFHAQTKNLQELLREVQKQLEYFKKLRTEAGAVPGLTSGFRDLDRVTTGFKGGELIVLAARPGHGKTSLALNLAHHVAATADSRLGKRAMDHRDYRKPGGVVFFSLEMTQVELAQRLVCSEAGVSLRDVRSGAINQHQEQSLKDALVDLGNAALFIDDSFNLSMTEIRAKSRRLKDKYDIEMVIVDYLQLVQGDPRLERHELIGVITRGLKALARELQIPVLALAQLNRSIEARRGAQQRPMLSDLRESGSIEQDADMVMFIQRDRMLDLKQQEEHRNAMTMVMDEAERNRLDDVEPATLVVAKNRSGPVDDVRLQFRKSCTRFEAAVEEFRQAALSGYGR